MSGGLLGCHCRELLNNEAVQIRVGKNTGFVVSAPESAWMRLEPWAGRGGAHPRRQHIEKQRSEACEVSLF
jgi:hypothetical protein